VTVLLSIAAMLVGAPVQLDCKDQVFVEGREVGGVAYFLENRIEIQRRMCVRLKRSVRGRTVNPQKLAVAVGLYGHEIRHLMVHPLPGEDMAEYEQTTECWAIGNSKRVAKLLGLRSPAKLRRILVNQNRNWYEYPYVCEAAWM